MSSTSTGPTGPRESVERRLRAERARAEIGRQEEERRHRRDRSLVRHTIVLLLVLGVMATIYATRRIPDPDYADGLAVTTQMDLAFETFVAGELDLGEEPEAVSDRVDGALVTVGERTYAVLTGEAGRDCYALWWDADDLTRHGRTLADGIACRPATIVTSMRDIHFERVGRVVNDPTVPYGWDRVLPLPERDRAWFLPVMAVLAGVVLSITGRIVTTYVTGTPPRDLTREERARRR
jgi:hypothetical protein